MEAAISSKIRQVFTELRSSSSARPDQASERERRAGWVASPGRLLNLDPCRCQAAKRPVDGPGYISIFLDIWNYPRPSTPLARSRKEPAQDLPPADAVRAGGHGGRRHRAGAPDSPQHHVVPRRRPRPRQARRRAQGGPLRHLRGGSRRHARAAVVPRRGLLQRQSRRFAPRCCPCPRTSVVPHDTNK